MQAATKNKWIAIFGAAVRLTASYCAAGPLIQTLLSILGFESDMIYFHSTLYQAANLISIILFSRFADKGNLFRRCAAVMASNGLLFLFLVPLCIAKNASIIAYMLLLAISVSQAIVLGLSTVCEYKTPYYIYRHEEYGVIVSISGVLSSVITFIIGLAISTASQIISYEKIMVFAFIVTAVLLGVGSIFTLKLKNITGLPMGASQKEKASISTWELFKHPLFLRLAPAGLFRGVANGAFVVAAVVALDFGYGESVTAAMVSVQSIASLISCVLFGWFSTRISSEKLLLWGSVLYLAFPLMLIKNPVLFLVLYAVLFFGKIVADNGVPTMLLRIVPVEMAGPYNAWRMALYQVGALIGTGVAALIPTPALLIGAAAFQLAAGIMYRYAEKLCGVTK